MTLAIKVKQMLGYYLPGIIGFDGGQHFVASWPNEPKPTIAEIEAVEIPFNLAEAKTAKQAALDSWWNMHSGVSITLADQSTVLIPIQFELVSFNASIVSLALLTQSDAIVASKTRSQITIPAAQVGPVFATFQAAYQSLIAQYNAVKAQIDSATDEASINAVTIPS